MPGADCPVEGGGSEKSFDTQSSVISAAADAGGHATASSALGRSSRLLEFGAVSLTGIGAGPTFADEYINSVQEGRSPGESAGRATIVTITSLGGALGSEALFALGGGAVAGPGGAFAGG